jgi:hypothetical protein
VASASGKAIARRSQVSESGLRIDLAKLGRHVLARIATDPALRLDELLAVELYAASIGYSRSGRLTMHVNKVHHVTMINRVAKDIGENENWLSDIANEMDIGEA